MHKTTFSCIFLTTPAYHWRESDSESVAVISFTGHWKANTDASLFLWSAVLLCKQHFQGANARLGSCSRMICLLDLAQASSHSASAASLVSGGQGWALRQVHVCLFPTCHDIAWLHTPPHHPLPLVHPTSEDKYLEVKACCTFLFPNIFSWCQSRLQGPRAHK